MALVIVHFTESLRGIRAVHAFRRQPRNDEIFGHLSEGYRAAMSRSFQLLGIYWPGIVLVGNLTTAAVLLYGGLRVIGHEMQVGVLAAFVLYLRRFFEPLAEVSQFYDSFQAAAAGLEKLAGVLDEEPGVPLPERGVAPARSGACEGAVEFRGVRFGYRDGYRHPLGLRPAHTRRPDRRPARGDRAGKSTVARLLARFYDPLEGEVVVDGIALPAFDEWHPPQGRRDGHPGELPVLGHPGREHRLRFPAATEAEIVAAAPGRRRRHLRPGARGRLRERRRQAGVPRLSAGQRQLVAPRRARCSPIPQSLILDEASSSLDAPMERLVQSALRSVLAGRTAVIIAHRLSTVEIADRVLVHRGRTDRRGRCPGRACWRGGPATTPTFTGRGGTASFDPGHGRQRAQPRSTTCPDSIAGKRSLKASYLAI